MPGFFDPITDDERKRLRAKADAMFGGPDPDTDIELELPPLAVCDAVQADEPMVRYDRDSLKEMDLLTPMESQVKALATIDHARRGAVADQARQKLSTEDRAKIIDAIKDSYRGVGIGPLPLIPVAEFTAEPLTIDVEVTEELLNETVIRGELFPVINVSYDIIEPVTVVGGRAMVPSRTHADDLPGLIVNGNADDFAAACRKAAGTVIRSLTIQHGFRPDMIVIDDPLKPENYNRAAAESALEWWRNKTPTVLEGSD